MKDERELEQSFIEKIRALNDGLFQLVETYVDGMLAATKALKTE